MNFNHREYLQEKIALVNQALDQYLPAIDKKPQILFEAMRYSVFAGGKRLRPILFLATLEALHKDSAPYLPFACALELIHTYSLIHDDLPAMDDDDLRRGQPTCHIKFGEAQAILAGDALLTYAFNMMLMTRGESIVPEFLLEAMDEVAWGAGIHGMIVGQVVDMESADKEIELAELQYIHRNKTGALFSASIKAAAILAGTSEKNLTQLTEYAEQLGLAFQITDDILDQVGDSEKLGKPIGSDSRNHKATYPALLGIEESRRLAQQAIDQAIESLSGFSESAEPLRNIALSIAGREK